MISLPALREILDLAKDRAKALEDDLNKRLNASEEDWVDIEAAHKRATSVLNAVITETEREISEREAQPWFVVHGHSIDGTAYRAEGSGWVDYLGDAAHFTYAEAEAAVREQVERNSVVDPDDAIGKLRIVEHVPHQSSFTVYFCSPGPSFSPSWGSGTTTIYGVEELGQWLVDQTRTGEILITGIKDRT